MIDTFNFRLQRSQFSREHILDIFKRKMESKSRTFYDNVDSNPGNKSITVSHKNYKFVLGDTYLTAYGSLTKLHYGHNVYNLTYNHVIAQLQYLEQLLEM